MTPLPPDAGLPQPLSHAPGPVPLKPLLARSPEVTNVAAGPSIFPFAIFSGAFEGRCRSTTTRGRSGAPP